MSSLQNIFSSKGRIITAWVIEMFTGQAIHGGTVWDPSMVQCIQNDVMF